MRSDGEVTVKNFLDIVTTVVVEALDNYQPFFEDRSFGRQDEQRTAADIFGPSTARILEAIAGIRIGSWETHLRDAIKADEQARGDSLDEALDRQVRRAGVYINPLGPLRSFKDEGHQVEVKLEYSVTGIHDVKLRYGVIFKAQGTYIPDELRANGAGHDRVIENYLRTVPGNDPHVKGYIYAGKFSFLSYLGHLAQADEFVLADLKKVTFVRSVRNTRGTPPNRLTNVSVGDSLTQTTQEIVDAYVEQSRDYGLGQTM
jgi:hypothetical protein